MATPKSWLPWAALAVVAALGGIWFARSTLAPAAAPQLQGGTWLPEPREVAAPALVDSRGAPFTQDSFTGHASVLFFGFTHCPDLCPTTMALLAQVRRTARTPFTVYLVSVDPERDTPEVLQA